MNLEVGKTYTDGYGVKYTIECQLKNAFSGAPAGSYLGTNGTGWNVYKEDGTIAAKCINREIAARSALLPNTVKKKGWVVRINSRTLMGMYAYTSEDAARKAYPNAASYHEIEWEEEEA